MKIFRDNEREIWLAGIPTLAALLAMVVGAFVPELNVGQEPFRNTGGFLSWAIATLGLTYRRSKHPRRARWIVFALIASLPALVRAHHGLEDILRAYAGMLPHVLLGLLAWPLVRALDRRFGKYEESVAARSGA